MSTKHTPDQTYYVYRGYLIYINPFTAEWLVSKGGAHICTCTTEAKARRAVEELI
jgi:hypothetical protein